MTPSITHLAPQGNKDAKAKKKAAAAEKKKATPKKAVSAPNLLFHSPTRTRFRVAGIGHNSLIVRATRAGQPRTTPELTR